ncbi:MAG: hypothetical protein HQK79_03765 [Desulfobacterales bacterium]|nr:hypothetical protein [Desulfobacterales bacterium]MBF0396755.1 hypothetical protein [Desulfobacterales bacterium]
MKNKTFDCVKMKQFGAEKIKEKIKGMTMEQELKFWKNKSEDLREKQKIIISQGKE